jgi:hypothetical protein
MKTEIAAAAEAYSGLTIFIDRRKKDVTIEEMEFAEYIATQAFTAGAEWMAGEAANSALTPFYDLAKKLGVSVDFSSKSYDGDLQPPMDAYGFAEYLGEAAHQRDGWIAEKPELNKECLLLTASYIKSHSRIGHSYWSYHLFEIFWISFDDGGYWGVLQDGEEWGDIADIKADLYQIVQIPQNKDK